ncbi:MAG: ribosome small subunit-dependent GTPase A [Blautia sp.]|nr:ribosome small subunit-dependent GTPase A [Blautia sp.]
MQGKIIKGVGGFYYVHCPDGVIYECRAKGIFRKDHQKPLVGDDVEITVLDPVDQEGSVTKLLPRKNSLIRPAVANVDQAFVIFAAESPKPNFLLLDRFLIMMERENIPAVICFNKIDLVPEKERQQLADIYQDCGYPVLFSSVEQQIGTEEIRSTLLGKTTVVAGPSGVGKSSLTNLMQEEVQMETGEISKKLKRGRHTTRHSQIIPVAEQTYLVDTPGFTSLYLSEMEEQELKDCFHEFTPYEGQCRFLGCRHIHEPDCRVREALESGKISRQRYEDYVALHEELKEKEKRKYQ